MVFVADSQITETEANKKSYADLLANLEANGLSADIPTVVQFNKRDLEHVRTDSELAKFARRRSQLVIPAIAIRTVGVRESLEAVISTMWDHLEQTYGISEKLRMTETEFTTGFFEGWSKPEETS